LNKAFAVFDSQSQLKVLIAVSDLASVRGVAVGMSKVQASLINDVALFPYSPSNIMATTSSILSVCQQFTPFIEDWSSTNECVMILDITGTEKLFNTFQRLAHTLAGSLADLGLKCKIAVSHNSHSALLLAKSSTTPAYVYAPPGEEHLCLAELPITDLPLNIDQHDIFLSWGLKTFSDVYRIPLTDLVSRMGEQAIRLHQLAGGCCPHNFTPIHRPTILKETFAYDAPVDMMESLLFTISAMVKQLISQAESELTSIAALILDIHLVNHSTYSRVIRTGTPTLSHRLLLKLIQLDLEANSPGNAVAGLTITAETGQSRTVQLGIFSPQLPEQSQLEMTLARIKSIVGPNNAGTPVLDNSHRQCASTVDTFTIRQATHSRHSEQTHRLSIRRLGVSISMKLSNACLPHSFTHCSIPYNIQRAYGPWSTTGRWWNDDRWCQRQWDVIASPVNGGDLLFCCISSTDDSTRWMLEGIYD
jgi:protein ImuB